MTSRKRPTRRRKRTRAAKSRKLAPAGTDSVSGAAALAGEKPPSAAVRGRPFPKGNDIARRYWFKKGESGNPGGVPTTVHEFREEVRKRTMAVLDRFDDVLDHGTEEGIIRAGRELFANAWSKPTLKVEASGPGGGPIPLVLTSDERRARAAALIAKARGLTVKGTGDGDPGDAD